MGVRVKDAGESECHAVIARIRIETVYGAATSSDPKGGRLVDEVCRYQGYEPPTIMYTSGINGGLNMWQDPIVKDSRELRKQYASNLNNDPDAIFEDILKRQEVSKRKRVSFPAKKAKAEKNIA